MNSSMFSMIPQSIILDTSSVTRLSTQEVHFLFLFLSPYFQWINGLYRIKISWGKVVVFTVKRAQYGVFEPCHAKPGLKVDEVYWFMKYFAVIKISRLIYSIHFGS